jgi:hypothetical protein
MEAERPPERIQVYRFYLGLSKARNARKGISVTWIHRASGSTFEESTMTILTDLKTLVIKNQTNLCYLMWTHFFRPNNRTKCMKNPSFWNALDLIFLLASTVIGIWICYLLHISLMRLLSLISRSNARNILLSPSSYTSLCKMSATKAPSPVISGNNAGNATLNSDMISNFWSGRDKDRANPILCYCSRSGCIESFHRGRSESRRIWRNKIHFLYCILVLFAQGWSVSLRSKMMELRGRCIALGI